MLCFLVSSLLLLRHLNSPVWINKGLSNLISGQVDLEPRTYTNSSFCGGSFLCQSHGWILRGLEHRFGFDGRRRWFGLGHPRAAVWTGIVSNQLTNKTLLIAFSVGGGNYFQADNLGAHRLTEHFLSSEREKETEKLVMSSEP